MTATKDDEEEFLSRVRDLTSAELEEETPPSRFLAVRILDRTVEFLAATTLAAITLIMFWNATSRYVFDSPLGWAEEIVTGLLLWLVMFGLFLGARRRDLILIRVFVRRLGLDGQVRAKAFSDAVTAVVLMHLAWLGMQYLLQFGSDTSAYLRLPKGFFTAALPIGAAAVAVAVVFQIRGNRGLVAEWVADDRAAAKPDADVPAVTTARPISGSRS